MIGAREQGAEEELRMDAYPKGREREGGETRGQGSTSGVSRKPKAPRATQDQHQNSDTGTWDGAHIGKSL